MKGRRGGRKEEREVEKESKSSKVLIIGESR